MHLATSALPYKRFLISKLCISQLPRQTEPVCNKSVCMRVCVSVFPCFYFSVCMCVRVYVCMCICMFVCMFLWEIGVLSSSIFSLGLIRNMNEDPNALAAEYRWRI